MVQSNQSSYQLKNILGLRGNQVHLAAQDKTCAIYTWDHIIADLNNYLKMVLNIYMQYQFSLFSWNFLKRITVGVLIYDMIHNKQKGKFL